MSWWHFKYFVPMHFYYLRAPIQCSRQPNLKPTFASRQVKEPYDVFVLFVCPVTKNLHSAFFSCFFFFFFTKL